MPKLTPSFGVLAVAALLSACSPAPAVSDEQLIDSTLRIDIDACRTGKVRATGIALEDGWVATVAHSFDGIVGFEVEGHNLELVYLDLETDIALLYEDRGDGAFLELASEVEAGPARMITYPRPDAAPEITSIEVLRLANVTLDGLGRRRALEITADISPGDSGSAVVNDNGLVIGMIFANARGLDTGWAIAAEEIAAAIEIADTETVTAPACP